MLHPSTTPRTRRVGQTVVGGEVDHPHVGGEQLRNELHRRRVGTQEGNLGACDEIGRIRSDQLDVGRPRERRVDLIEPPAGIGGRRRAGEREFGVAEYPPDNLDSCIACSANNRDFDHACPVSSATGVLCETISVSPHSSQSLFSFCT